MRRDPTADALAEAFPDTRMFVVLPEADWNRLLAHLKAVAPVPSFLRDISVMTVELEPA